MAGIIDYGILISAFLMNLVLLFLICFRTPQIMKNYQPVLLCGWFADFIFNISALVGRPLYLYHDGIMYMLSVMFFSKSSNHFTNKIGIVIWIYGFMQLMVLPAFQFFTRYLMVVWNIQLKAGKVLLLLLFWNIVPVSYTIMVYFTCVDDLIYQQTALRVFGNDMMTTVRENKTRETRFVLTCDTKSNLMLVLCGYAFLQIFVTYGMVVYCGYKIYSHLQLGSSISKAKMQNVQKQITNILLVQAITPPLMGGLPLVYIFVMAIMKINSLPLVVEIFDRVLAIVPIINPILAIYFVKPYRKTISNALACSSSDNQITSISNEDFHGSEILA